MKTKGRVLLVALLASGISPAIAGIKCKKSANLISCADVSGAKREAFCWKKAKIKEQTKNRLCMKERKKRK